MREFHGDKQRYFEMQYKVARDYIAPFIGKHTSLQQPLKVLEIGCAEAGVLKAFLELGHDCTGIELLAHRVETAKAMQPEAVAAGKLRFLSRDIYDIDTEKDLPHKFDIIILKDVIEHIHDQERFIPRLKAFLNPGGKVFFGFPPWYMPFGGHQQKCKSKLLSYLPYYHLLPMPLYKGLLRAFGESNVKIENLAEIKETGISIERFEKIVKRSCYHVRERKLWLFNPIYQWKFHVKPKKQATLLAGIPYFRDFVSTCAYYMIEVDS